MTRVKPWIPLLTLALGLLTGALLRPAISTADNQGTPQPYIVTGFSSDVLIELPASAEGPNGNGPRIELRTEDGSTSPASLSLVRYTYEPGGALSMPYPFPGPVAFYVESGTLTLEAIGPNVRIAKVQSGVDSGGSFTVLSGPDFIVAGNRYDVAAGNYVYAFDGEFGPTSNHGPEPLTILSVFFQPESGGESVEETSGAVATAAGR